MSLPRYQAYKTTSAPWMPSVPGHWQMLRADAVLETRADQVAPDALSGKEVFHYSIPLVQQTCDGQIEDGTEILSAKLIVSEPCVLLSKLNPRKGTVCIATPKEMLTVSSGEFVSLIPRGPDLRYVYYVVQSTGYRERLESLVESATRSHARVLPEDVRKFQWAFPPYDEQVSIASFLDRETAKIDALVAAQERLMALLREKRQAVISHAVTKGLNPGAPMKASGVQWLGEVPAHWVVAPLRRFPCRIQTGPFGSQLHADEYVMGGIPVVNPLHMVDGRIEPDENTTVSEDVAIRLSHQRLRVGDVVFARRGELGRCALVTDRESGWLCGTGSMILRLNDALLDSGFLRLFLSLPLLRMYFESCSVGSTMDSLSESTLYAMPMLIPPIDEQKAIAAAARRESEEVQRLIETAIRTAGLLRERRDALISAAVTGQIDVRHLAPADAA